MEGDCFHLFLWVIGLHIHTALFNVSTPQASSYCIRVRGGSHPVTETSEETAEETNVTDAFSNTSSNLKMLDHHRLGTSSGQRTYATQHAVG